MVAPPAAPVLADAAGRGGDFVRLAPSGALLETRTGVGASAGLRGPGSKTTFPVLGVGGVPASGVRAVMVDITAIAPSANTYLTLYPDNSADTTPPALSTVNVDAGKTLSNSAVVDVGANGRLTVYNAAGNTHIAVDVQGYFTSSVGASGGGFVPVTHTQVVDTRSGLGGSTGPIPAGGTRDFTLTGGVVPADASAILLDAVVVVTSPQVGNWLAVYPTGSPSNRSVMDYLPGATAHGISVRPNASGQVTFVNGGASASPIHLVLTVQGYFTPTPASGAGLRTVAPTVMLDTRTGGGAALPPDGIVDVQIGGRLGLPTRGIAGAVLNLTVVGQTEVGYLRAWPLGGPEPAVSLTNYPADTGPRAGVAVVKPGAEGKIRIRNVSTGSTHLIVGLQGWFADPLPPVQPTQNARVVVRQSTPTGGAAHGSVEYAFVNNLGVLQHGRQENPNSFGNVVWASLPGNEQFTGLPAIGQLADGRVQITAQATDSNLSTLTQSAVGSPGWGSWTLVGGSMASSPTAARRGAVPLLFAVDTDGALWVYEQTGTSPYWRSLGDADLVGQVAVAEARDDGLHVVGIDTAGAVKAAKYRADTTLSTWTSLGGTGITGLPAVVSYPGYRLGVFVRGADGIVVFKEEDTAGAFPAAWSPVGDLVTTGSPQAILDPVYGRTAVVARAASDSRVHVVWETAVASRTWGTSTDLPWGAMATDPTVADYRYTNGQSWMIVARDLNGDVRYALRDTPPSAGAVAQPAATPSFTTGVLETPADSK
ncbi:hypothetical protein WEI85_01400 [Actinomycetes bacterium KLBMP 9797]